MHEIKIMHEIKKGDCIELMRALPDGSIDAIVTDPPYKYLKGQKLETDFNEVEFFTEAQRILKKDGMLLFFGRGASFYRWGAICDELGMVFKEEVVWNKSYSASPVHPIQRIHETVAIFSPSNGKIRKTKIPYIEMKFDDLDGIRMDINCIKTVLNGDHNLDVVQAFLDGKEVEYIGNRKPNNHFSTLQSSIGGYKGQQTVNRIKAIATGMFEKSIIKLPRDHYKTLHPTQKPVRLMERLIALVSDEGDLILDPFAGSGSTLLAAYNTSRRGLGFELDDEYHDIACRRLVAHMQATTAEQAALFADLEDNAQNRMVADLAAISDKDLVAGIEAGGIKGFDGSELVLEMLERFKRSHHLPNL